jgi:2-oxoglutarate dehydrogenase complex dehydrogenase (E1) component-like enzyme
MHITNHTEKAWLMHEMEKIPSAQFSKQYKLNILEELNKV